MGSSKRAPWLLALPLAMACSKDAAPQSSVARDQPSPAAATDEPESEKAAASKEPGSPKTAAREVPSTEKPPAIDPECHVPHPRAAPAAYREACRALGEARPAGLEPRGETPSDWRPVSFERGTLFMPPEGWLVAGKPPDETRIMAVDLSEAPRTADVSCSVRGWFPITREEVIEMADTDGVKSSIERRDITVAGHEVLEQRYDIDAGDGIIMYPQLDRWYAFGKDATVASCSGNGRHGFDPREPLLRRILDTYQPRTDAGPSRVCREYDVPTYDANSDVLPAALAPVIQRDDETRVHFTLDGPVQCGAWFHVVPLGGGPLARAYVDLVEERDGRYLIGARLAPSGAPRIEPEAGRPVGIPTDALVFINDFTGVPVRVAPAKLGAGVKTEGELLAVIDLEYADDEGQPDFAFAREGEGCLRLFHRDDGGAWTPTEPTCW